MLADGRRRVEGHGRHRLIGGRGLRVTASRMDDVVVVIAVVIFIVVAVAAVVDFRRNVAVDTRGGFVALRNRLRILAGRSDTEEKRLIARYALIAIYCQFTEFRKIILSLNKNV